MTAYLVEVGILLADDDKEYDKYAIVYDKCHGYYDENQFYTKTKEEAIKYVKDYIKRTVDVANSYGVVSETNIPYDYDFEDGELGEESYHPSDVVYSIAKIDGKIKENFIRSNNMNNEKIKIELPNGGYIIAERNPDPDYDGVSIFFETEKGGIASIVCVECKAENNYNKIDVYTYENEASDEFTRKFTLDNDKIIESFE